MERNWQRGVWLPPHSCVVVRDVHRLAPCQIVAEDVRGNVPHAQRSSNTAPGSGIMFFFGGIALLLEPIGAPVFILRVLLSIALLALVIGVVYLLPFLCLVLLDPYYQYLKRHGLLDATGKPLPDADIERILAEREGDTSS